jgi:type II secretory pathway component PulL
MAVAAKQGGRVHILDLIEKEIPETSVDEVKAMTASVIRQAVDENRLADETFVASLPVSGSIHRVLTTPLADLSKIRDTLKFQMEPLIPYPVDQVVTDCIPIRALDDGTAILSIALTKEPVAERLGMMEMAGVEPEVLTLDALALADFYVNPIDFLPDRLTALLLAGREGSFLGFFDGQRLVEYRNLDGVRSEDGVVTDAAMRDIRRSLLGIRLPTGETAEIGMLCVAGAGGEAIWRTLQESFREIPVRYLEFSEQTLVRIPDATATEGYEFAIALARAGLTPPANAVNFRKDEFAPPSVLSGLRPTISLTVAILAIVMLAWFGSVRAQIHRQSKQLDELNKAMVEILAETMPGTQSPAVAEQKMKAEQEKFKSLRNYSSAYVSPIDVLAEVVRGMPNQKDFALNELHMADTVLRMRGVGDSYDEVDTFKRQAEKSPLLSDVQIDSATKEEKGEKISFRIRARIEREAPSGGTSDEGGAQ